YVAGATRGRGLFDWAAKSGHVGIADTTLSQLDGGTLAFDVDQIRAMAHAGDTLHYVARTTPSFQCTVRVGPDIRTDSVPFACAPDFTREGLALDGAGNRYYFEAGAYRVLRLDAAGLLYGSVDGRWNRVGIDVAVDPNGLVWVVGGIGSQGDTLFGGFIARHAFELSDEPAWEAEPDDTILWTAIAMGEYGPIVLGHEGYGERLHARGYDFDGALQWEWSHEPAPQTYVDAAAVDAEGSLIACGTRYEGHQTPIGDDEHHPVLFKFGLQTPE
ncbi:MAG: hypothetical protein AAF721_16795, partial [Myxococcota bacterium]